MSGINWDSYDVSEQPKTIKAKADVYKGIKFRSKLESKTAQALDTFGIPWEYEPKGYKLSNGLWYKPDFLLPVAHQYIECKGVMDEADIAKIMGLVNDTSYQVLALSYDNAMLFMKYWNESNADIVTYDEYLRFGRCSECGGKFIYCGMDTYQCTCCGEYDGDHHLGDYADIESATQLFQYAQEIAANNPTYKEIAKAFNKEV